MTINGGFYTNNYNGVGTVISNSAGTLIAYDATFAAVGDDVSLTNDGVAILDNCSVVSDYGTAIVNQSGKTEIYDGPDATISGSVSVNASAGAPVSLYNISANALTSPINGPVYQFAQGSSYLRISIYNQSEVDYCRIDTGGYSYDYINYLVTTGTSSLSNSYSYCDIPYNDWSTSSLFNVTFYSNSGVVQQFNSLPWDLKLHL